MTKYLIKANYNSEGVKGLLKSGGKIRKSVVDKMVKDLGGELEAFYYAFGDPDIYGICSFPDTATAVAFALSINSSGLVSLTTTILIDPEEIDKAKDISVTYRTPGN